MSKRRAGTCGDPGPSGAHCSEEWDHQYSCYDASEDVSFNDRQDFTHDCGDPECSDVGLINEGD